jgi:hypothetical protein
MQETALDLVIVPLAILRAKPGVKQSPSNHGAITEAENAAKGRAA